MPADGRWDLTWFLKGYQLDSSLSESSPHLSFFGDGNVYVGLHRGWDLLTVSATSSFTVRL